FEECATSLDNPWVRERIKKALARWRKANAVFVGVTQTVESLRTSGISRMLIEQTPTQIFSGNPKADEEDYRRVLALSARELETVKTRLGPREILVKQNHLSAVVELDLRGFTAELHVLSGRREHRELIQRLRQEHGEDWLARFLIESVAPKREFTHA
ncbi:MAG: VirB4 family type IV secretion/conjugal transfer ATPase, partial [Burkholderiales bacterium]